MLIFLNFLKKIALFQITWLNCPTPDQLLFFPFNCFIRIFRHFLKQFGHCVYAMPALILSLYLFWISKIKKLLNYFLPIPLIQLWSSEKRFTTEWERLNPKILNEIKASKAAQSTITTTKLQPKTSKIMMKKMIIMF